MGEQSKQNHSCAYKTKKGLLFVPTEDMWLVHEQAKPAAIMARAGLTSNAWADWKRRYGKSHPWVFDWLYNPTTGPSCGQSREFPTASALVLEPTEGMKQFRLESSQSAIASAAARTMTEQRRQCGRKGTGNVSQGLLVYWLNKHQEFPWFGRWLLRGEDPPVNVTVANRNQIRRCREAWHYIRLLRMAGIKANGTYYRWIEDRQIPNADWLKWLYGGPVPNGVLVVPDALQEYRRQRLPEQICRAAGIDISSLWLWKKNAEQNAALSAAIRGVSRKGQFGSDWAKNLHTRTRNNMLAFAKAATLRACLARAGLDEVKLAAMKAEARRLGAAEDLQWYLDSNEPLKSGLVRPRLFIPSSSMLAFRRVARAEMARLEIWTLKDLTGFDEWLIDWTTPRQQFGLRNEPTQDAASEPRSSPNTRATRERSKRSRAKHLHWQAWKAEGLTNGQIAIRHNDQTGESVTEDAVKKALKRLKQEGDIKGDIKEEGDNKGTLLNVPGH